MVLYPKHIPTTCAQKLLLTVGSGVTALLAPWRGDMVATFGEVTGASALPRIRRLMERAEEGRAILAEKPRITDESLNLDQLRALPDRTLGREYARFLDRLKTTPDARPPVQFIDSAEDVYIMQRYRETHDLTHVVLDMPTNMLGEVTVKWWEAIQLRLPMAILGAIFGPVRLGPKHSEKYRTELLPWVTRVAPKAEFFMRVYWERYWTWPIEKLRAELNVEAPPGFVAGPVANTTNRVEVNLQ